MKHLPNIISCFRIALSGALFFFTDRPAVFIFLFILCGISDAADGYIARRFGLETRLGARLDSLGDFLFTAAAIYAIFPLISHESIILSFIVFIFILRIANLTITKLKFRQWGVIHTIGSKVTGAILFVFVPVCVARVFIPFWPAVAVCAASSLSALDETAILLTSKTYDENRPAFFYRK